MRYPYVFLWFVVGCYTPSHFTGIEAGPDDAPPDARSIDGPAPPDADPGAPDAGVPANMVLIGAGPFDMGCSTVSEPACNANELPLHTVTLHTFVIDWLEVSRNEYGHCVDDGVCLALAGQDPSEIPVAAPWQNAAGFCAWAGKRLPTEAEWERAARGATYRIYPWGDGAPDCTLANFSGCGGGYIPVSHDPDGASPEGAYNMAGNAAEWVSDWYLDTYYSISPTTDPRGPSTGANKIVRGGSGADLAASIRTAVRSPKASTSLYGFRCAKDYP